MAGESRHPSRDIGRSVVIASPIIFSDVHARYRFRARVSRTHRLARLISSRRSRRRCAWPSVTRALADWSGAAGDTAAADPHPRRTSSFIFTGVTRLPMVAGWDHLIPAMVFTTASALSHPDQLHHRFATLCSSLILLVLGFRRRACGRGFCRAQQRVEHDLWACVHGHVPHSAWQAPRRCANAYPGLGRRRFAPLASARRCSVASPAPTPSWM